MQKAITVRLSEPADAERWADLYRGYREFYRLEPNDEVVDRVWRWTQDPDHELNSFVAVYGAEIVGLANCRRFTRPSSGTTGLYLDDLFTVPAARGHGVGRALLRRLSEFAHAEGLSVVRWMTSADNTGARRLYDEMATLTKWVTYELAAAASEPEAD